LDTNYAEFASSSSRQTSSNSLRSSAARIVSRLFDGHPGNMVVALWNGEKIAIGDGKPEFTIVFRSVGAFRKLCFRQDPILLVDAYFSGAIDVEGDFYRALDLETALAAKPLARREKLRLFFDLLRIPTGVDNNPAGVNVRGQTPTRLAALRRFSSKPSFKNSKRSIAFHYDVSNEFYRLWLDERMVYSCGYFTDVSDSLATAQSNKLDHICLKLRLRAGERMLDIGCGWGALAIWAAQHYGVHVTGITLSQRQYDYANALVTALRLQDRVSIRLQDYRHLANTETFDKVSSVGMFEHVGLRNLPLYFSTVHRVLKPGGLFLNHGITHDEEGWHKALSTTFINRYVFPDGELDTVSNVQREMERSRFEIWDVEGLRPHYALTLRAWVSRLEAAHEDALEIVDESTYRVWRLYMAASAKHFEQGDIGVYQILASKRAPHVSPLPLTRGDIYAKIGS
jgi:cyclopropane-fatty-acyl-phospholipid synthase